MPPQAPLVRLPARPLYGRSMSILFAALENLADGDADVLPVLAGVGLRRAPQPRSSRMPAADTRHKFINHQHRSALVYQAP
jgi:hypothetical protein